MARSWGQACFAGLFVLLALPLSGAERGQAAAGAVFPLDPRPPPDPSAMSATVSQGEAVHIFDTSDLPGDLHYVNDHTLIQAPDRSWHLFGIFHREPMGEDSEFDFIHAIADEPDPARWSTAAFVAAPAPHMIALHADRAIGETHIWAPHVVAADGRYWMIYQGGGADGDRASIRLAESDDLYRWKRVSNVPLFEDVCVTRDPMLVRRDGVWALYYTRCASTSRRVSGVAFRLSHDLAHWTEPHMALVLPSTPTMANSGFTESPFVFERDGYYYLSVSPYPLAWDATLVYRSPAPFAFPSEPYTRLRAHAAEWLPSKDGKRMYMTHAGPGQRGVWMSPIDGL